MAEAERSNSTEQAGAYRTYTSSVDLCWLIRSAVELLDLPERWNSYQAKPIDPACILAGLSFAYLTCSPGGPWPKMVPQSNGGVQLEWHVASGDVEVYIEPGQDKIGVWSSASGKEVEWDGAIESQPGLMKWLVERVTCGNLQGEIGAHLENPAPGTGGA